MLIHLHRSNITSYSRPEATTGEKERDGYRGRFEWKLDKMTIANNDDAPLDESLEMNYVIRTSHEFTPRRVGQLGNYVLQLRPFIVIVALDHLAHGVHVSIVLSHPLQILILQ